MKIIASVCVGVAIFAMCMFVGGIFLAIVAHMLMLFLVAEETKKNEPYAINTIVSLEKAAYEVSYLINELEDW